MFPSLSEELAGASNAVDGLKSYLEYNGGQCVISADRQYSATWWVNLTEVLSIHHITIYYRTGNLSFGMLFFLITSILLRLINNT